MKNKNFPPTVQIDIEKLWNDPDIQEGTRDVIWQYIGELNKLSQMYQLYTSVPTNMMNSLSNLAQNMANDIQEGKMNLNNLNFNDISSKVKDTIEEEDINQFANNVHENPVQMTSIMNNMMTNMFKNQQQ